LLAVGEKRGAYDTGRKIDFLSITHELA
jgi:hypothetical protein